MKVNPNIFRLYDIRGCYPNDLSEETAYNIGCYFGKLCSGQEVIVGYDGRLSSVLLYNALSQGLAEYNVKIASVGLVPSPVLYFADNMFQPEASIMITASHNPKNDNGFKIIYKGKSFFGDQISLLKDHIVSNSLKYNPDPAIAADQVLNLSLVKEIYLSRVLENIQINPEMSIVWDSGNGACGDIISDMLNRMPNKNIHINSTIDGDFPNHHPDPTVSDNLQMLIYAVKQNEYDLGIAFDGDGDRVGFVTAQGDILLNDQLLCIFAEDVLLNNPSSLLIGDVRTSQIFFDYVKEHGGKAIMSRTGHSFIKSQMQETGASFAGEFSGHMFFADKYLGFDDGMYSALRMIDILSRKAISLDKVISKLPTILFNHESKIAMSVEQKFHVIEKIKNYMKECGRDFIDLDGVRYSDEVGWWLVRASNTEDIIVTRCEARSERDFDTVKSDLDRILNLFIDGVSNDLYKG
jgi:phosphomannomutase